MNGHNKRAQVLRCLIAIALISLPAGLFAETKKEDEPKPKLLKVSPTGVYANKTDFICPLYHVTVMGENLPVGDALKVFVDDRQLKVVQIDEDGPPRKPSKEPNEQSAEEKAVTPPDAYVQNPGDGSQIELWINGFACSGVVELRVGLDAPATPPPTPGASTTASPSASPTPAASPTPRVTKSNKLSLTLAKHANTSLYRKIFRLLVFAAALLILLIPIFLIRKMIRKQIATENSGEAASYSRRNWWEQYLTALFLDRETATYSLSKFQFYIWTAVSVMAYLYLAASRAWVQGVWTFIALPDNLPGIVFISGATGVMAVVATNSRGPKGAGDVHPSLADFVCSGGVVAVERVQFLIWTIIGALMFLWLSLVQTPVDIMELPKVPDSFLQLMGISSLGYLGGKFARKAGPIINDVSVKLGKFVPPKKKEGDAAANGEAGKKDDAQTSRDTTILTIRGRILSPDADFKITYETKDKNTPAKEVSLTDHFAPLEVKVLETDDQTSSQNKTAKKLELTIDQPTLEWLNGATKLLISNPDGQTASWALPRLPKITGDIKAELIPPGTPPPDGQVLKLTLTGENLARVATFEIGGVAVPREKLPPAGIKIVTPDEESPLQFATSLELTISTPDPTWISAAGNPHTLTIKNSEEMKTDGTYQIKPPAAPAA
ncbi:MAG: hypothetical protein QOK24_224 [Verrucomicrobiota bacterium]|jgi:hypothetical protein